MLRFFFDPFLDYRDEGKLITSHFSLLLGISYPIWISYFGNLKLGYAGMATIGVGDVAASVFGKKYGKIRWPYSEKTVEGSLAFALTTLLFFLCINVPFSWNLVVSCCLCALLEALSTQIDNLFLPLAMMWLFPK